MNRLYSIRCLDRTFIGSHSDKKVGGVMFISVVQPSGVEVMLNPSEVRSITEIPKQAQAACLAYRSHQTQLETIIGSVAEYYQVPVAKLLNGGRRGPLVKMRHVAMHLCLMAGFSASATASAFMRKAHGTIIHASESILARLAEKNANADSLRQDITALKVICEIKHD